MKLRTWCIRMGQILTKTVLVFTGFLIFLILFKPAISKAEDDRGGITIRQQNAPIEKVFQSIEKQSGYRFFYNETLLQAAGKVTLNLQNVSLQEALEACFLNQPLSYAIVDKTIIVKKRQEQQPKAPEVAAVALSRPGKIIALRGKVTSNKVPVAGASIMIKGTENGASTDKEGMFTLPEVEDDATLVVSSVSHTAREVRLNGQTFISIDLSTKTSDLDEAIVVAYNTTTKKMNTGSVSVVKGSDIQNSPGRSIDRALQGMVPGLQITTGSGLPGGNVANIVLRGIATGGDGISRNPLYVIDGTPLTQENFNNVRVTRNTVEPTNPLSQINPNDIESISVLKDAAAIALYGSRASNGVILITTKQGMSGRLNVNFRHQTDIAGRVKAKRDVLSQDQYLELLFESYKNASATTWTDKTILTDLRNKFPYQVNDNDTVFYEPTNWFNELYHNSATSFSNDLSFSGGSNKATYYLSIGHLSEQGVLKNTGFKRSSLRYNATFRLTNWLNFGVNSAITYSNQDFGGANSDGLTDPNGLAYYISPLLTSRLTNGKLALYYPYGAGGNRIPNPVAAMEYNQYKADGYRGLGNVYGEVQLLPGLSFRTTLNGDLLISKNKTKVDKRVDGTTAPGTGTLREVREIRSVLQINNLLKYQHTFVNSHFIDLLVSHEAQTINSNLIQADGSGFISGITDDEITSATTKTSLGSNSKTTFLSYFAQANYSFRQKYNASVGLRLDGSSRFGANLPLNKFWSFGLGYVLTEESFMKSTRDWLNFFKIRGSVGVAGNTIAIPTNTRYDVVQPISYTTTAVLGTTIEPSFGNPNIKSESTFNTDLGFEARFLKDRVSLTADIYKRKTYDMVTKVPQPLTSGRSSVYANLGDIENSGIEIGLSFDVIRSKNFSWNIGGNWSTNKNKLVKASNPESFVGKLVYKVGENYESWYMVQWAGVDSADGAPQWLDKDGKITKTYNSNNRVVSGNPQPTGFGSVTTIVRYKNVELSGLLYYAYGFKIYNSFLANGMLNDGKTQPYNNQSVLALDRWQKPGDQAKNPKRVLNNPASGPSTSTRFLTDGDYIRLKNLRLSYSLQQSLLKKLHLVNTQFFVQGNNLALWTKSEAIDPDNTGTQGENNAAYPLQKSLSVGLNLNF